MSKKHVFIKLFSLFIFVLLLGISSSAGLLIKIDNNPGRQDNRTLNGSISREKMIEIAQAYANFEWYPTSENIAPRSDLYLLFHSIFYQFIQRNQFLFNLAIFYGIKYVDTPDRDTYTDWPDTIGWKANEKNIGVPYQWGGFSSISGFYLTNPIDFEDQYTGTDTYEGMVHYAGDIFCDTWVVSYKACGVDCSGFVSRCWNLSYKQSTRTLNQTAFSLPITIHNLQMGDILLRPGVHVMLFKEFTNENRTHVTVYEAGPCNKVGEWTYKINEIIDNGHALDLQDGGIYHLYTYNAGNLI